MGAAEDAKREAEKENADRSAEMAEKERMLQAAEDAKREAEKEIALRSAEMAEKERMLQGMLQAAEDAKRKAEKENADLCAMLGMEDEEEIHSQTSRLLRFRFQEWKERGL